MWEIIYTTPKGRASIDDTSPSRDTVYSSAKTEELIAPKINKFAWTNGNLVAVDRSWEALKDSWYKWEDFSLKDHIHKANNIEVDETNLWHRIPRDLKNVQAVIEYLDDWGLGGWFNSIANTVYSNDLLIKFTGDWENYELWYTPNRYVNLIKNLTKWVQWNVIYNNNGTLRAVNYSNI